MLEYSLIHLPEPCFDFKQIYENKNLKVTSQSQFPNLDNLKMFISLVCFTFLFGCNGLNVLLYTNRLENYSKKREVQTNTTKVKCFDKAQFENQKLLEILNIQGFRMHSQDLLILRIVVIQILEILSRTSFAISKLSFLCFIWFS